MLRRGVIGGAMALALAFAAPAAAKVPCGPSQAHTLTADRVARVYVTSGNLYGCASGTHRSFLLGTAVAPGPGRTRTGPVALGGTVVAYAQERTGVDVGSSVVIVQQLKNGKILRNVSPQVHPGVESYVSVGSLVVRADGAVAFIAGGSSIVSRKTTTVVERVDRHGDQVLDSSSAIDMKSLRLSGMRLSWVDAGRSRSGSLN